MEDESSNPESIGRMRASFRITRQSSSSSVGEFFDEAVTLSPYMSKPHHRPTLLDRGSPMNSSHRGSYDVSGALKRLSASMGTNAAMDLPSFPNLDSKPTTPDDPSKKKGKEKVEGIVPRILGQIPAVALIGIFHLMIGIPFGVSYFPIYWNPHVKVATEFEGPFPLPGKEALGIRMFLFSTIIGQLAFTATSKFPNPIGLQMVENVPFCHELAAIVISHQGYGTDAISTLIVMFGLSSLVVGIVFYTLGKCRLGRLVYFFPVHVLIGCIGGIGVFISKTAIEVTVADQFSFNIFTEKWNLLRIVFAFEVVLRALEEATKDKNGKAKYALLSPIYFCMITPIFYIGVALSGMSMSEAEEAGYFFPPLVDDEDVQAGSSSALGSIFRDEHVWDMWTVIDFPTISWRAIWESLPTMFALTLFSLIHVPINIPAFALSTNTEADMNNELIAHGYSNMISGMFGGLQNYMTYTQSVLYDRSGGTGKASGVAIAIITSILFFVGPEIASYIPRCMAGTLLFHVGIDLFLEGVWDSYGSFDALEYVGIWLIVIVMTAFGMEAAMVAGIIAAVSTYAVQSVAYLSPIRGYMPATTLRSSAINRNTEAESILNSSVDGRSRILVVQLQGHLFFGNMAHFTESMDFIMSEQNNGENLPPIIVIMDCSLVLGIDSSAARTMTKVKDALLRSDSVELCIFVSGSSEGFPTEFKLSDQLCCDAVPKTREKNQLEQINEETALLFKAVENEETLAHRKKFCGSCVRDSLDSALNFAENALISRQDPSCLTRDAFTSLTPARRKYGELAKTPKVSERELMIACLHHICPVDMEEGDAETLFTLFQRELYYKDDFIWKQGDKSDCVKVLLDGTLIAAIENEAGTTETIPKGSMLGELGLLNGDARMSSVICRSDNAVLYSMSRESFEELVRTQPRIARYLDLVCIRYLAHRLQHVSNRIFETRCLPV